MADVTPLEPDPRGRVSARRPGAPPAPTPEGVVGRDEVDDYVAAGIDRRELRKLRRGDYPVEDRLDLHGHIVRAACDAVDRFIRNSRHAHRRCVCIVHGKGQHSETGTSALRDPVRNTLRGMPDVLAFTTAPVSDGGSGALYILLRRRQR